MASNDQPRPRKVIDNIIKSEYDRRQYRYLWLDNDLRVLLVSDPETDKAAAAMNVGVGFYCDPDNLLGLAHFAEHMLFLGTKKYPDENSYSRFLASHNGTSNAFTSHDNTVFFFAVDPPFLEEALDRFAQFFLEPLFTPSATERELNAVDSEHSKNLQQDSWRIQQFLRYTSSACHPYHRFNTGNTRTLLPDGDSETSKATLRKALLDFHDKYYSSNIMTLAVISREPLSTLEALVVPQFSKIANKHVHVPDFTECLSPNAVGPFEPHQHLGKLFRIVPVRNERQVQLVWPLPGQRGHYRVKPTAFLAHLLGHEGPGSILSWLKSAGLCNGLVAGLLSNDEGFALFRVTVDLAAGAEPRVLSEIVTLVYQYLALVAQHVAADDAVATSRAYLYEECRAVEDMHFRFKEKESDPMMYAAALATAMHVYHEEPRHVLVGDYLMERYDRELIVGVLKYFTPENMRVHVISRDCGGVAMETEPWYGTQYAAEKFPEELVKLWKNPPPNPALHLPAVNEFIPTDFSLKPPPPGADPAAEPIVVRDTAQSRVFVKQDLRFRRPKAQMYFEIVSPIAYEAPAAAVMSKLYGLLVMDALNEYAYSAEVTGLHYSLLNSIMGLQMVIRGYNDKMMVLLEKILHKMRNPEIVPSRFELLREAVAREFRNFTLNQPQTRAIYYSSLCLENLRWTNDDYIAIVDHITLEDTQRFIQRMLSSPMYVEALVIGNVTPENALQVANMVEDILLKPTGSTLLLGQRPQQRIVRLHPRNEYIFHTAAHNPQEANSAIENLFQIGQEWSVAPDSLNSLTHATFSDRIARHRHKACLLDLFAQIVAEQAFHVLRTQWQLGYLVHSGVRRGYGTQGWRVVIQSASADPVALDAKIEEFIAMIDQYLTGLSEEQFQDFVRGLVAFKLESDKNLQAEAARYWSEIINHTYRFSKNKQEAEEISKITKDEVVAFYRKYIARDAPKRQKLSTRVFAGDASDKAQKTLPRAAPGVVPITNLVQFKRGMPLYPLPH